MDSMFNVQFEMMVTLANRNVQQKIVTDANSQLIRKATDAEKD